ncbi:hypothetical protein WN48_03244 [Eufriesea mexicana]|nr:hypothetical protein WN48_03244 [Eufriesea mexicana]
MHLHARVSQGSRILIENQSETPGNIESSELARDASFIPREKVRRKEWKEIKGLV